MNSLLQGAAFGLAPVGELFARELHAADVLKLRPDQEMMLGAVCARYTEDSDRILVRMAALASSADIVAGVEAPTAAEAAELDALLVERSALLLELERAWVARRLEGLGGFDAGQVATAAALTSNRRGKVLLALQGDLSDTPVTAGS
ncbi:hypothetical protein ND748_11295 [Frankia sp. AiPs1]|uniref:hypothetical protein n=1 Tax=Frankia sp. AiPs1 TaxID=573493 RepID=UPI002044AD83|nr:hypothetical protein [Frankia sp. AiPs1]MCM3922239.1 hypothetical protein [Frankia sp. AiPs1]